MPLSISDSIVMDTMLLSTHSKLFAARNTTIPYRPGSIPLDFHNNRFHSKNQAPMYFDSNGTLLRFYSKSSHIRKSSGQDIHGH